MLVIFFFKLASRKSACMLLFPMIAPLKGVMGDLFLYGVCLVRFFYDIRYSVKCEEVLIRH